MIPWADLVGPGAEVGQLGALLYIAHRLGRVDALAAALGRRLGAVEIWAAHKGHIIEERKRR